MSKPSAPNIEEYIARSKANAAATIEQIRALAAGNAHLTAAAVDSSYTIGAEVVLAEAFIWGKLQITNATYQGWNISYNGTMWGIGLGGGVGYGALTLAVPPNQLNGLSCSFQLTNAAAGVTVQIWNDTMGYVANFTGPMLAVALGVMGGSGSWSASQ